MSQMDFSPEQDWQKILTPLGVFIKPFLVQNKQVLEPLHNTTIPLHRTSENVFSKPYISDFYVDFKPITTEIGEMSTLIETNSPSETQRSVSRDQRRAQN